MVGTQPGSFAAGSREAGLGSVVAQAIDAARELVPERGGPVRQPTRLHIRLAELDHGSLPIAGAVLLLAVAGFCVFGFLATFEPTRETGAFLGFRIGYAIAGLYFSVIVHTPLQSSVGGAEP